MEVNAELVGILGAAVASAFALIRLNMNQNRSLIDRFVGFLEAGLNRTDKANERIAEAVDRLVDTVHENTTVIRQLADRSTPWR
jgi:hypothetical protein